MNFRKGCVPDQALEAIMVLRPTTSETSVTGSEVAAAFGSCVCNDRTRVSGTDAERRHCRFAAGGWR